MCILLLLNKAESLTFAQIMQTLAPQREETESALLSLTADLHPLLVAEPPLHGARVDENTTFKVNAGFKSPATQASVVVRSVQVQDEASSKDDVSAILYVSFLAL